MVNSISLNIERLRWQFDSSHTTRQCLFSSRFSNYGCGGRWTERVNVRQGIIYSTTNRSLQRSAIYITVDPLLFCEGRNYTSSETVPNHTIGHKPNLLILLYASRILVHQLCHSPSSSISLGPWSQVAQLSRADGFL